MNEQSPIRTPSTSRKVWNAAESLAAFVADGLRTVSREEYAERLAVCNSCPQRINNKCQLCGCNLSMKAKGRAMKCPDYPSRWPKPMDNMTHNAP